MRKCLVRVESQHTPQTCHSPQHHLLPNNARKYHKSAIFPSLLFQKSHRSLQYGYLILSRHPGPIIFFRSGIRLCAYILHIRLTNNLFQRRAHQLEQRIRPVDEPLQQRPSAGRRRRRGHHPRGNRSSTDSSMV